MVTKRERNSTQQCSELHIEIDRLVVEGLPRAEAKRVGAALERELARLLGEQAAGGGLAAWQARGDAAGLDLGTVRPPAGLGAAALGGLLARRIAGGMQP
jgi:hypothetical protein